MQVWYTQTPTKPSTRRTFWGLLPQPPAWDLVHVPGFHHNMIRFCAMHSLASGIYLSLAADMLLWMCQHKAFGTRSQDLDVPLQHAFEASKILMSMSGAHCSGRQRVCRARGLFKKVDALGSTLWIRFRPPDIGYLM